MKFDNQDRLKVSGPLTDTELRATPVPVSGPLTDAQLRATAVPVSIGASSPAYVQLSPYNMSPFGGVRAASDLVFSDNVHPYPGATTAYDPDVYGYEKDGGSKGSIAHLADQSALALTLSDGTNGAKSRLRTHDQVRYQSGAPSCIEITGYQSNSGVANQVRRLGIFDDEDGVFFQTKGTTNYLVLRSSSDGSTGDDEVQQSSWNVSTYPGLDITKGNRFRFVIAWLGVEGIQCFINGVHVHTFSFANTLARPYMKSATLPISAEIVNTAAASAGGTLTYICSSARILNGGDYALKPMVYSRATTGVAATLVPLYSIRINATVNTVNSRVQFLPKYAAFFSETAAGAFALVLNPSLTGATWAATSPSPAAQIDTAATAMSGGTGLFRQGQGQNVGYTYDLSTIFSLSGQKIRKQAFTGTSDILTVGVIRETAVSFDPRVTIVGGLLY